MSTKSIAFALQSVRQKIVSAEAQFHRPLGSVTLLAVSKGKPASTVREAYRTGQTDFGESYVQEATIKLNELSDLDGLRWHFIGRIQANKTRFIANRFDWVHSLDRLKVARRLSEQRDSTLAPLSVCLQVNLNVDSAKAGITIEDAFEVGQRIAELPRLQLRGFMTIPEPTRDFVSQRLPFRALRELFEKCNAQGLALDTLSMGMSDDLEAAIAEGATIVRVGTAIFGPRDLTQT
ncbi:MAG: YggS family pyridoxal phosphate-dependent enzyme [Gammaproteobacteria bacterium]